MNEIEPFHNFKKYDLMKSTKFIQIPLTLIVTLFVHFRMEGQIVNDSLLIEFGAKQKPNYMEGNAIIRKIGNVSISFDSISKSLVNYSYQDSIGNYFLLSNKEVIDSISNFAFQIPCMDTVMYDYFMASNEFSWITYGNDQVLYETYYYTDGLVQKIKRFKFFDSCRLDVTLGENHYLSEVDDSGNGIMRVYNVKGELIDVFLLEKYRSVLHEKIKLHE